MSQYLINGFTYGFVLNYQGPQRERISLNHQSARNNSVFLNKKLHQELDLGRIAGPFECPPLPDFQSHPLGLVPKKSPGDFRIIHDLSYPKDDSINTYIPKEFSRVHYENLDNILLLVRQWGMASVR